MRELKRPSLSPRRLILIVLLTYAGVCVLIGVLQSRLIYFPTREYHSTPKDIGLPFEDLTLTTADKISIAAWYVPADPGNLTIIFCHGNAGNISDRLVTLQILNRLGLNVLIFDYRGYGRSTGKPNESGTYQDAETAWRYLVETRGANPGRIVLVGRSLGGAVAIELASRHTPAALVVESTFTNLIDIGRLHYPLLPVRWLLTYEYDSMSKVSHIRCPKLFIHGEFDELIPPDNGRRLFDAAAEPKTWLLTPGGHNDGGFTYSHETQRYFAEFLSQLTIDRNG